MFSLAALISEMLSGRRSPGVSARSLEGLTDSAVTDLPGLQRGARQGDGRAAEDRYETATAFAEALKRATGGAVAPSHR